MGQLANFVNKDKFQYECSEEHVSLRLMSHLDAQIDP